MKTTEILMNEHQIIKTIIREVAEKLSLATPMSLIDFNRYYNFFVDYADIFHHKKEEKIYFEWLLSKDANLKQGPVGMMLNDHEVLRATINKAREYIIAGHYENFKSHLMQYCDALYNHIFKEDNILYSIAENINKESQDGDILMLENFQKIQSEEEKTYSQWKDYPIHAVVQKESEALQGSKGQCGGCCGMC